MDGQAALHVAVQKQHYEMVGILLEKEPNVNTGNARGWRPKALTEQQGHADSYGPLKCQENRNMNLEDHKIDFIETETVDHILNNKCSKTRQPEVHIDIANSCIASIGEKSSTDGNSRAKSSEVIKSAKKRVTIHMHFKIINTLQEQVGRVIILPDSLEELLTVGGKSHLLSK